MTTIYFIKLKDGRIAMARKKSHLKNYKGGQVKDIR